MKLRLSLTHKVALWLLINLTVLITTGAGFMVFRYGIGWNALIAGPAGEQVRNLSSLIAAELRADPEKAVDTILAGHPVSGAHLALFVNDNEQIGGTTMLLPDIIQDELSGPPPEARRPPGPAGPGMRPGRERDQYPAFFFHQTSDPSAYWIGLRMPVQQAEGRRPTPGTLIIAVPSAFRLLLLLEFGPWFAAVGVAFLLSIICWAPFVTSLRRDLLALTAATEHLADGRFATRVPATRRDELGSLGTAVNQMAERLDVHAQSQKRFLGDVAHELGSPIGRLQVAIELLERRAGPEMHRAIADVREEIQLMSALVNELLAFTKAGLRPRDVALETVELNPLLTDVIEREGATDRVTVLITGRQYVRADAQLLNRALSNLIRNALRYGDRNAPITVTVTTNHGRVHLTVADEGPGVPTEALVRLGEPFFRPESARSRDTGGVGLGLAIVRSALTACGGTVHFANRQPRGFAAEVTLDVS